MTIGTDGIFRWFATLGVNTALAAGIATSPVMATSAAAEEDPPSYSILYSFTGNTDGGFPVAGLIRDGEGNLYGTTSGGGLFGNGVVFELDPTGRETVLYSFTGGPDGGGPSGDLIRDDAGNLYGTTAQGGTYANGVVFKLAPNGNETVLYAFTGGSDGGGPAAGLIRDHFGNLYGTAMFGGSSCPLDPGGCGVVFKLDPSGEETVLHSFSGGADGANPSGDLIQDDAGNLYSTTESGGNTTDGVCFFWGCGVVFKLDRRGKETVLHTFSGGTDGDVPYAGLILDDGGNLYGTTGYGGNTSSSCVNGSTGCGVVFKINRQEKETVLYRFTGGTDGLQPFGGLILDDGYFYGTTFAGGVNGYCCGTLFKLDLSGAETVLHTFAGTVLSGPVGSLIRYGDSLYGVTNSGGSYGQGVIFKLQLP